MGNRCWGLGLRGLGFRGLKLKVFVLGVAGPGFWNWAMESAFAGVMLRTALTQK